MTDKDSLTGLASRGAFDSHLAEAIACAAKAGQPLSLIIVDVDHFKKVNDTHGHSMGDAVLSSVAARIGSAAGGKGGAYRYGGEEFAVILSNHDAREATALAERMRREIESTPIEGLSIAASFGVASFPDHGRTPEALFKAADAALYDAKNRGRNLVRVSGDPAPSPERAREPERKPPQPGKLTEEQRDSMRQSYFKRRDLECPVDGTILEVREMEQLSSAITRLQLRCKMCGFMDEI